MKLDCELEIREIRLVLHNDMGPLGNVTVTCAVHPLGKRIPNAPIIHCNFSMARETFAAIKADVSRGVEACLSKPQ